MRRSGILLLIITGVISSYPRAADPIDLEELRPGLIASYRDAAGTQIVRLDPTIGLTWKAGETAHPRLATAGNTVKWQGYINILRAGNYRFSALVHGLLKVSIAGKDVLLADSSAAKLQAGAEVKLDAGVQAITVDFTRTRGPARLELFWQSPSFATEPVPFDVLFHLPKQCRRRSWRPTCRPSAAGWSSRNATARVAIGPLPATPWPGDCCIARAPTCPRSAAGFTPAGCISGCVIHKASGPAR